ncbi:hypothetical protein DWV00_17540 [Trinickia dinghuensis]|uniref:Uncharacterized protein n=1 Tax=Trinickia dinghuensis TaxID=2291023 RepID=A0A3D8JX07_9BURK|nr:hypothetical protein DWV00_17540 [Trinickia dinghuensis]
MRAEPTCQKEDLPEHPEKAMGRHTTVLLPFRGWLRRGAPIKIVRQRIDQQRPHQPLRRTPAASALSFLALKDEV